MQLQPLIDCLAIVKISEIMCLTNHLRRKNTEVFLFKNDWSSYCACV